MKKYLQAVFFQPTADMATEYRSLIKRRFLLAVVCALSAVLQTSAVSFYYTYNNQTLKFSVIDEAAKTCMVAHYDLFGNIPLKVAPHDLKGEVVIPEVAVRNNTEYRVIAIGEMSFWGNRISSVVIPNSVTTIGAKAFGQTTLESVTLPETLTEIPDEAFSGCMYLESINIPDGITSIGSEAFNDCYSLKSFHMPNSLQTIGRRAFSSCMGIQEIDLPETLKAIGYGAFSSTSLKSIVVPKSVTSLERYIFGYCQELESATVLASVSEIPDCMFYYCHKLKSVELPETVTSFGEEAFDQCHALETINLPEGLTSIGQRALSRCHALKTLELPKSLKTIGNYGLENCKSLESVILPESLTTIGDYALNKTKLTTLVIPNSVEQIGKAAFGQCSNLSSVYYSAETARAFSDDLFSSSTYTNATLHVTDNAAQQCEQLAPWSKFQSVRTFNPTEATTYHPLLEDGKSWILGQIIHNSAYLKNHAQMPRYQKVNCEYKVIGDTIVENTPCKIVATYRADLERWYKYILCEENGIVSMFNEDFHKQPFVKLFDFNAKPGNELKIMPYDSPEPLWDHFYLTYTTVDSKFAKGNDQVTRKEIVLNNSSSWVEGIGGSIENWLIYQSILPSGWYSSPELHMIECRKDGKTIFSAKDFARPQSKGLLGAKIITPGKSWTMARGSETLTFTVDRDTLVRDVPCRVIACSDGKEYIATEESGMVYAFSDRFGEADPDYNAFPIAGSGEIDQRIYRVNGAECAYMEYGLWMIDNAVDLNVNGRPFKEYLIAENNDNSGNVVASWVDGVGAPDSKSWAVVMPEDFQTLRMIDCRQDGEVIFTAEDFTYQSSISEISADAAARQGVYDLQGRRVTTPTRGLYIIDGKKQLIR
ncbi:MAG: leucine-rich repeat domain-containing protein [Muribaculaceae bacterium]|nr:leucine-rich repeat domain-containing protein [Muribaculaceae bacterium]